MVGIRVVDHTTGRAYETIAAASKELYISCSALRKNRRRKGNRFTFYDHDLEFIVPEWRTKREGWIDRCYTLVQIIKEKK